MTPGRDRAAGSSPADGLDAPPDADAAATAAVAGDPGAAEATGGTDPAGAALDASPDAAAEALSRARAAARARGLRPGSAPRRTPRTDAAGRPRVPRDPALISDVVERLVEDRGWVAEVEVGGVMGRWPQIVGAEVAANAHPESFADGVLVVRASSTAWATQLRLLSGTLLRRIAEETGPDAVVELRVLGPTAPSWSHGRRRVSDGRGPRDTYG